MDTVYSTNNHCITVIFDSQDPEQVALARACVKSFGEEYTRSEDLTPLSGFALDLLPGGACR